MNPGDLDTPPAGYQWVWVPTNTITSSGRWETTASGKPCRYTVGPGRRTCKRPSVARLWRKTSWWHYCEDHLYSRRVRGGVVECRILRPLATQETNR